MITFSATSQTGEPIAAPGGHGDCYVVAADVEHEAARVVCRSCWTICEQADVGSVRAAFEQLIGTHDGHDAGMTFCLAIHVDQWGTRAVTDWLDATAMPVTYLDTVTGRMLLSG